MPSDDAHASSASPPLDRRSLRLGPGFLLVGGHADVRDDDVRLSGPPLRHALTCWMSAAERLLVLTGEPAAEWVALEAAPAVEGQPRTNDGDPVRKGAESVQRFGFGAPDITDIDSSLSVSRAVLPSWRRRPPRHLPRIQPIIDELQGAESRCGSGPSSRASSGTNASAPELTSRVTTSQARSRVPASASSFLTFIVTKRPERDARKDEDPDEDEPTRDEEACAASLLAAASPATSIRYPGGRESSDESRFFDALAAGRPPRARSRGARQSRGRARRGARGAGHDRRRLRARRRGRAERRRPPRASGRALRRPTSARPESAPSPSFIQRAARRRRGEPLRAGASCRATSRSRRRGHASSPSHAGARGGRARDRSVRGAPASTARA